MSKGDAIGDRMKKYENVNRHYLIPRTPTIIRVDGKAFHTYTKTMNFTRPFSDALHQMMQYTAQGLFKAVQNTVLCYYQSDEISLLLNDWRDLGTQQWFGGNIQKIVSVSASEATASFTQSVIHEFGALGNNSAYPRFDSRVFQLPKEEVNNYFLWRQQDATRNSLQMLTGAHYSHKEMHGKNSKAMHDMLFEKEINWNDLDTWKRRGACIRYEGPDEEIPLFNVSPDYINELLR